MSKDPSVDAKLQKMMAEMERKRDASFSEPKTLPQKARAQAINKNRYSLVAWKSKFLLPLGILAIPWLQLIISQLFFQGRWHWLIYPRSVAGIPGIFLSAFSHSGWAHLIGNSIAFAIFSWLILLKSQKDFWTTFAIGWIGGGFACWLLGPQNVHGLSGVVFTLFGYLLVIGWLEKRFFPLLVSVFVAVNYSYCIFGILPTDLSVAWWGHLFGFLLGIFAAYGVYREPKQLS
jgi:membrane associated rhomboid family serine protease